MQPSARNNESNVRLTSEDQLPQDAQFVFSVRAKSPATFGRDTNIEVATADEAFATTLSFANRGLTLADAKDSRRDLQSAEDVRFLRVRATEASRRGEGSRG